MTKLRKIIYIVLAPAALAALGTMATHQGALVPKAPNSVSCTTCWGG